MSRKRIRLIVSGFMSAMLLAGASGLAIAQSNDNSNGNSNAHNKVTLCHATGSKTNTFVRITVDANGAVSGHAGHQDQRDIIPPFTYNDHGTTKTFAGLNWTAKGQATFNNGCVAVSGGLGGGNNESQNQVATNTQAPTAAAGQGAGGAQAAAQVLAAPQGGVAAGGGGAKAYSPVAALGLIGSLVSFASGMVLLRRF